MFGKLFSRNTDNAPSRVSKDDPSVKALIDEAIGVINDMLNVGNGASYCSELEYEGLITVTPVFQRRGQCEIIICMHNVSELKSCSNRYPKARQNPANFEMFRVYDRFAEKYFAYYDYAEKGYVYRTKNVVSLSSGAEIIKGILLEQVKERCPHAKVVGASYIKDKKFDY